MSQSDSSTPDVVKKMDVCSTLSSEICNLVTKQMESVEMTFSDCLEKERVRMQLNKKERICLWENQYRNSGFTVS